MYGPSKAAVIQTSCPAAAAIESSAVKRGFVVRFACTYRSHPSKHIGFLYALNLSLQFFHTNKITPILVELLDLLDCGDDTTALYQ